MAAIAFNPVHQAEHIRGRLKTVPAVLREMLDAFVSDWMRRAAAEAGHARPRQRLGTSSPSINAQ